MRQLPLAPTAVFEAGGFGAVFGAGGFGFAAGFAVGWAVAT